MKRIIKKIKQNLIGFILGAIIFSIVGVYAATQIASSNVSYSGNGQSTVQGALNDLFSKVGKCPEGQICLLEWPWQPKYFAYGTPTTSSTTNYTTIGKNVFAALDTNGNKGVCIIKNNHLHCFKPKNINIEQIHVQQVFSDGSCGSNNSSVYCGNDDFDCNVYSDGDIYCFENSTRVNCFVSSDGSVECGV